MRRQKLLSLTGVVLLVALATVSQQDAGELPPELEFPQPPTRHVNPAAKPRPQLAILQPGGNVSDASS